MIAVIALLALAADETSTRDDLAAVAAVYAPWVGALSLILDSYIDQDDDAVTGAWSFVTYFDSDDAVRRRGHELIERAMTGVGTPSPCRSAQGRPVGDAGDVPDQRQRAAATRSPPMSRSCCAQAGR